MLILNLTILLLTISIVYLTWILRRGHDSLLKISEYSTKTIIENNSSMAKIIAADTHWQVATINHYLGDELEKLKNVPEEVSPVKSKKEVVDKKVHRKRKKRHTLTPEQRQSLSLRAKERWALQRKLNPERKGRFQKAIMEST